MGLRNDLTMTSIQCLFLGSPRAGWVCAVWLGTRCKSFSKGQDPAGWAACLEGQEAPHVAAGAPGLRSRGGTTGQIAAPFLCPLLCRLLLLAHPSCRRDPRSSWLWETPPIRRRLARINFTFAFTELCRCPRLPFRKSIVLFGASAAMSVIVQVRCLAGLRGCCALSGLCSGSLRPRSLGPVLCVPEL